MVDENHNTRTRPASLKAAVDRVRDAEAFAVDVPGLGRVPIPRPEKIAYYATLAALAAIEVIDWPIALIIAAGHALAEDTHSRVLQEFGEAAEDA
jgi:hypothetical protein